MIGVVSIRKICCEYSLGSDISQSPYSGPLPNPDFFLSLRVGRIRQVVLYFLQCPRYHLCLLPLLIIRQLHFLLYVLHEEVEEGVHDKSFIRKSNCCLFFGGFSRIIDSGELRVLVAWAFVFLHRA